MIGHNETIIDFKFRENNKINFKKNKRFFNIRI